MAAFIVIGAHEQVKGVVDGISKCHPLNPAATTIISSGTIIEKESHSVELDVDGNEIHKEEISLWYKYTIFNGNNTENENDTENENIISDLNELLYNQIAHLRTVSLSQDSINIFIVANLLSDIDVKKINYVLNEIKSVSDPNIQVFLIVIAYDLKKTKNVSIKPCKEVVRNFLNEINDGIKHLMYLSNKDLNHSAVNMNENYLAEMLSDYFMLLSNENNAYNAYNAINNKFFSIGYSSFKYEYSDFKQYIELTTKIDFIEKILNEPYEHNDEFTIYNFEENPFSLNSRRIILENRIKHIEFYEDINLQSDDKIDKRRNEIIIRLKKYINIDEYIDRNEVFKLSKGCDLSKLTQNEKDEFNKAKAKYEKLIDYICTDEFFENAKLEIVPSMSLNPSELTKEKERNLLQKLFNYFGINKKNKNHEVEIEKPILDENLSEDEIRNLWIEFKDTFNVSEKVSNFCSFVNLKEKELTSIIKAVSNFKLTENLKIKTLIDLKKLKAFQIKHSENILKIIIDKFKQEKDNSNTKNIDDLFNEEIANFILSYQFVDWSSFSNNQTSEKFSFIKDLTTDFITQSISHIQKQSIPFITYNDVAPENARRDIIKLFYMGNKNVINLVVNNDSKLNNINDLNAILGYKSTHIENKMCMFQIQPIDDIDYLCDCRQ